MTIKDPGSGDGLLFTCACGGSKSRGIRLFRGDLTLTEESYDVVVCSAYIGSYTPTRRSLIGALHRHRDISVGALSLAPEMDLRSMNCWMSRELKGGFRRIACLELTHLNPENNRSRETINSMSMLKSAFITLRFLMEKSDAAGIPVRRVALPVLGVGEQGVGLQYVAAPLFTQCMAMFSTIPSLETIDFYEIDEDRAEEIRKIFESATAQSRTEPPKAFLSYSSRQIGPAHRIRDILDGHGITVWIAPESIPAGSNYLREIPAAIGGARMLLLLLTPEAQDSPWVQNEVASAIGAKKAVLPVQVQPFEMSPEFRFLLTGKQIFPLWQCEEAARESRIVSEVREKLKG